MKIRVLLADDQSLVREGLSNLLKQQPDLEIVAEAENGKVAVELAHKFHPNVVLMDVRMPIMDGVAATRNLQQQLPEVKVLILSTFSDIQYLTQALKFGAKGYLLKNTRSHEIADAIRLVHQGHTHFGPGLFDQLLPLVQESKPKITQELEQLTPREKEVLKLIAQGYSNREIAQKLYLSEQTVKNHVSSILHRLNLRDRTQAALIGTNLLNS
ncbi:response regulator transcription factor [Cronbergia sp. UHCC 0137]|uniref:response regulator transcription factor n=1 Tax=Cronbergia sp. UHCC 0137 TaxID=3110239 RepID=UPI002B218F58|nr:response regulator transcription factor [Cronbergia sp. UHCC 0137]MEA5620009.1 response regulator transcription factor [Cronbergia sp. UHCC 0137]